MRGHGGLQLTNPQYEILDDEDGETIHTGRIVPVYEKTGKRHRQNSAEARARRAAAAAGRLTGSPAGGDPAAFGSPVAPRGTYCRAFPSRRSPRRPAQSLRDAGAAPLDFRGGVPVSDGRPSRDVRKRLGRIQAVRDRGRRPDSRVGAPGAAVQADAGPAAGAEGDRRGSAAASPDEPPAAGRRRRPARRSSRCWRRSSRWKTACRWRSWRRPRFSPSSTSSTSRGCCRRRFRVSLLTGSTGAAARKSQLAEIESGAVHLVVGTHALVQGDVRFKQLGLVVIDEQHRFGVLQRATLRAKGLRPDVLVMTATPIPAHAGAHAVWRPGCVGDPRHAARAASRSRPPRSPRAGATRCISSCASSWISAGRRM